MPRIPRSRAVAAADWQRFIGSLLFIGGACLWMGEAMRAMASS
jgi:hypothetical protein